MGDNSPVPGRSADLPAGYDEANPYEGEDLESYPKWWRENVEEFQEHNMRPYRPPRFSDGTIVPKLVHELREEFGVDIKFQNRNPQFEEDDSPHEKHDWDILVDGDPVGEIARYRSPEGYSVYDLESTDFERVIREQVQ